MDEPLLKVQRGLFQRVDGGVKSTLVGHTARVNCVKWLQNSEDEFISGGADNNVVLWTKFNDTYKTTLLQGKKSDANKKDILQALVSIYTSLRFFSPNKYQLSGNKTKTGPQIKN